MNYTNIEKRDMLISALFQHSTKLQSFKKSAIDRIVERIIYFSSKNSLTIKEIQDIFRKELEYNLPLSVFEKSIKRLIENERLESVEEDKAFILTLPAKDELKNIQIISEKKFNKIINKLFHNAPTNREKYIEPFWYSMEYIFSNIGKFSAKLVEGKIDEEDILNPTLNTCISNVKTKFNIDYIYFEKRIKYFFEETKEPVYNEFKWVLAQNYFITSSLGISPESENFSKELFENTILYLDTNVILSLISEKNIYYNNAISFIEAANKLNIKFRVCKITFVELERWLNSEQERIILTQNQIPKSTKSKIGSCIYQDLQEKLSILGEITIEEKNDILNDIVKEYFNYKDILEKLIPKENIEYVDDKWFDEIEKQKIFDDTLTIVKDKYQKTSKRKKSKNAAIHDTKILLWLNKIKKEDEKDYRFVTSDYSLPLIKFDNSNKSHSILLEAILQWLVPLTGNGNSIERFSNTLKQKILPKEFIFEVKDFLVFEELNMQCQELPSEDVEQCIIYLKQNAYDLNPTEPSDREKIASEVAKYFLDPGRKYKKELSEKEKENEKLKKQLGDIYLKFENLQESINKKNDELENVRLKHKNELEKINEENDKKIEELKNNLDTISKELTSIKEEKKIDLAKGDFKTWEKQGKYAFIFFLLLFLIGVFELLPSWNWNYPAKLIIYINSLKSINEALYGLLIGINIFLLTAVPVGLFAFSYRRLFNKDKRNRKKNELGL